ncbi:MAG: universal stress protein [Magnetococcus sp. YQC-5]
MNDSSQPLSTGMFKNILLATDGSEFALGAERLTTSLVLRFGGLVTAMQMAMFVPFLDVDGLTPDQWLLDLQLQEDDAALKSLSGVKERMGRQGVSCNLLVKHGNHPHKEIIDAAAEIDADLVVVGRRGRRGLARMMLGDATARIVAQSPRHVLVVPMAVDSLWRTSILLATDGTHYSGLACIAATRLARESRLPLRVISVVESKSYDAYYDAASMAVEQAVAHAKEAGVMVQGAVLEGHQPADVIADEAYSMDAGLVVGGSHGRTGLERVFIGSVMERLLGKVSCPVLVAKRG